MICPHRRVARFQNPSTDRVGNMARPSKGDRAAHMVKTHPAVTQRIVEMASEASASSVMQYVADVLALYVGLPQHVRELNQPSINSTRQIEALRGDKYGRIMVRPHREVSERLTAEAPDHKVSPHIADVLAVHVGLPQYARTLNRVEEVLPLAM
jgi:predicted HicB family RNase H-like nuclease